MTNINIFDVWVGVLICAVLFNGYYLRKKSKVFNISVVLIFLWMIYIQLFNKEIINNLYFTYYMPVLIFAVPWMIYWIDCKRNKRKKSDAH